MKIIFWKFSDYEIKKDVILFNRIILGSHFKGVKSYGIEFHFEKCTIGFSSFFKKWALADDFSDNVKVKGKFTGLCIRLGSPIITLWTDDRMRDKAIEALNRYKLTK